MFELVGCRSDLWRVYLRDDSGIPPDGLEGQLCLLEEWFTIDWDSGPFLDGDLRVYHTATPVIPGCLGPWAPPTRGGEVVLYSSLKPEGGIA